MYTTTMEEHRTVGETKGMASKEIAQLPIYVPIQLETQKTPLNIIGKSKNPHCFKLKSCSCQISSQVNAWFVQTTWFPRCVSTTYRSRTSKPVLLVRDNCSGHVNDPHGQVSTVQLPPTCTSKP